MSSSWLDIYSSAHFVVYLPDMLPLTLRHGERHENLDAFLSRVHPGVRAWAFITAWNPRSRPLSQAENQTRQALLVEDLRRKELTHYPAEGRAAEGAAPWSEDSVFVIGMDCDDAIELGKRYEQNAILVGAVGEAALLRACLDGVFEW